MDYDESDQSYYEEDYPNYQEDYMDEDYEEEGEQEDEYGMPIAKPPSSKPVPYASSPSICFSTSPEQQHNPAPRFVVLTNNSSAIPEPVIFLEKEEEKPVVVEEVKPKKTWNKIEAPIVDRDPWKFLEPPSPPRRPPPPPYQSRPPHHQSHRRDAPLPPSRYPQSLLLSTTTDPPPPSRPPRHQSQPREKSLLLSSANKPAPPSSSHHRPRDGTDNSNKLCKYAGDCRMDREKRCTMVHNLKEWKPKVCHLNTRCPRKNDCGYYHLDIPIETYLSTLLKKKDTIYNKNVALYQKYIR